MKKYYFLFSSIVFLILGSCSNNDNQFYNVQTVSSANLLIVPTQSTYAVNDILYVTNTPNFSRYLNDNQINPLDIFRSTGGATAFNFSYILEKEVNGIWNTVDVTNNLVIQKGLASFQYEYILGSCQLNSLTNIYEYNVGIQLVAAGTYRLSFNYNGEHTNVVNFRSDSQGYNMFLDIDSAISTINTGGYYTFTVN